VKDSPWSGSMSLMYLVQRSPTTWAHIVSLLSRAGCFLVLGLTLPQEKQRTGMIILAICDRYALLWYVWEQCKRLCYNAR